MRRKTTIALVVLSIVLVGGAGAFLFARIFLIRLSLVPSGAMKNTIIPGDHILSVKLFGKPERGSVILFQYPRGTSERDPEDASYYIARIVGLPGETIQLRGHTVYINEQPLDEIKVSAREETELGPLTVISTEGTGPYQVFYTQSPDEPAYEAPFATTTPLRIPPDYFFVLGDHRDNSEDSRFRGPVPRELIWGTASHIYLSVSDSGEVRTERSFRRVE